MIKVGGAGICIRRSDALRSDDLLSFNFGGGGAFIEIGELSGGASGMSMSVEAEGEGIDSSSATDCASLCWSSVGVASGGKGAATVVGETDASRDMRKAAAASC